MKRERVAKLAGEDSARQNERLSREDVSSKAADRRLGLFWNAEKLVDR